jgi:hypothetical protein
MDVCADSESLASSTRKAGAGSGSLASCLSMGLAFISRQHRTHPRLSSRLLVVQCGADDSTGYIPLMNCAFLWCVCVCVRGAPVLFATSYGASCSCCYG